MHFTATYILCAHFAGNPRRKVHQTEQSGFKIFRPTTRELLFTPQSKKNSSQSHRSTHSNAVYMKEPSSMNKTVTATGTLSIKKRSSTITGKKTLVEPPRQRNPIINALQMVPSKRDGLPELSILATSPKMDYSKSSNKCSVHLPDIVGVQYRM